jgi:hypothetical protein
MSKQKPLPADAAPYITPLSTSWIPRSIFDSTSEMQELHIWCGQELAYAWAPVALEYDPAGHGAQTDNEEAPATGVYSTGPCSCTVSKVCDEDLLTPCHINACLAQTHKLTHNEIVLHTNQNG